MELFYALGIIGAFYFGIQLMYYLKFVIQKWMWLKEQKVLAEVQNSNLVLELKKLELQLELKKVEV